MKFLFSLFILCFLNVNAIAQCNLDPTIEGENALCPYDSTATLSTQQFDSYQWYYRDHGDTVTLQIQGATQQNLALNLQGGYYSVEVTDDTCVAISDEFSISVIHFIPPELLYLDGLMIDSGGLYFCDDETATLGYNYTHNIIWFKNGDTVLTNEPTLEITEAGVYTVQASPEECPEIIFDYYDVEILTRECPNNTVGGLAKAKITLYPNPTRNFLNIQFPQSAGSGSLRILDPLGKTVLKTDLQSDFVTFSTQFLTPGIYTLVWHDHSNHQHSKKFVKL